MALILRKVAGLALVGTTPLSLSMLRTIGPWVPLSPRMEPVGVLFSLPQKTCAKKLLLLLL